MGDSTIYAFILKAIVINQSRYSDFLRFTKPSHTLKRTVTKKGKTKCRFTAAGTVRDFHPIPL